MALLPKTSSDSIRSRATNKTSFWNVDELDLIGANETFATQAISVNRDVGWDTGNVNGGATLCIGGGQGVALAVER